MITRPPRNTKRRSSALLAAIALSLALSSCAPVAQATQTTVGPVGVNDGQIAEGHTASPFDDSLPGVTKLEPGLLAAVRQAATDAAADGIEMWINSGWRSARYQQELLDAATLKYGSLEEALKWVDTADRSTHVTGRGVDIGPTDADSWLRQHGSNYGLCQTFANEMWHFELAVEPGETCPAPAIDATGR